MSKTYGKFDAKPGESCSNGPWSENFTTPCCYVDVGQHCEKCPGCGAPIKCEFENQPVPVCTIREDDDDTD